jgi:hypothetical protein
VRKPNYGLSVLSGKPHQARVNDLTVIITPDKTFTAIQGPGNSKGFIIHQDFNSIKNPNQKDINNKKQESIRLLLIPTKEAAAS